MTVNRFMENIGEIRAILGEMREMDLPRQVLKELNYIEASLEKSRDLCREHSIKLLLKGDL